MVANLACGQLNKEDALFPCPRSCLRIWSRGTGSAVLCGIGPLILTIQAESGACSRAPHHPPASQRAISMPTVNGHRTSPELSDYAVVYRWCSSPTVRRNRTGRSQGSLSYGCSLYSGNPEAQFSCAPRFPHALLTQWACAVAKILFEAITSVACPILLR